MSNESTASIIAKKIYESHLHNTKLASIKEEFPDFTIEDAYRAQLQLVDIRMADGEVVTGKKVGLTTEAAQKTYNITEPDFGFLFANMEVTDGKQSGATLQAGRVEGEIAFKLKQDLPSSGVTVEDVIEATEWISGAFEIVDSRLGHWDFNIVDTVSDNGSSVGYVLGNVRKQADEIDLCNEHVQLFKNGELSNEGVSSAVLGNPAASVAWLANALGKQGLSLKAGEIILTGAIGGAAEAASGDSFELRFEHLGELTLEFL